jgi:hypothetical protein
MIAKIRSFRMAIALAGVLLAGCASLDGVRDFGASAARMTDYRGATDRYFESVDRVLAELPATPDFDDVRTRLEAQKREQAGQKATLLKLHAVTTGYMAALARLAGDRTFDLSDAVDKVGGQLVPLPALGIGANEVSAFARIAQAVTDWTTAAVQARDVKRLARDYGDAMDTLLGALQTVTGLYETALKNERDTIRNFEETRELAWQSPIGREADGKNADRTDLANRREAVVAWARRSYAPVAQEEADAIANARRAALGVAAVRAAHAQMLTNLDRLDRPELVALLKKTAADLKAIRADLAKG